MEKEDLTKHKLQLRKDFKISSFLEKSGLKEKTKTSAKLNTKLLSVFTEKLTSLAVESHNATTASFEEFLLQLLAVMRKREKVDGIYEQEQLLGAIDELKLQMLRLLMMHEG